MSQVKKAFNICLEGNICSGKTTFLKLINSLYPNLIQTFHEPIEEWKNVGNANIFQMMANDPERWSFTFQMHVQNTLLEVHEFARSSTFPITLMERSIYSARYCFVENLYNSKLMNEAEYAILDRYFKRFSNNFVPDLILYLRIDPNICHERLIKRGRYEESNVTNELLVKLHFLHEKWLLGNNVKSYNNYWLYSNGLAPVLIIDNQELETMKQNFEKNMEFILEQLNICE